MNTPKRFTAQRAIPKALPKWKRSPGNSKSRRNKGRSSKLFSSLKKGCCNEFVGLEIWQRSVGMNLVFIDCD
jgi:hypothetical protein